MPKSQTKRKNGRSSPRRLSPGIEAHSEPHPTVRPAPRVPLLAIHLMSGANWATLWAAAFFTCASLLGLGAIYGRWLFEGRGWASALGFAILAMSTVACSIGAASFGGRCLYQWANFGWRGFDRRRPGI